MEPVRVYFEHEAIGRLHALGGITPELLHDVVESTYRNYVSDVTELEPPNSKGLTMWTKGTRMLRENLLPLGWHWSNSRGFPITISPDGRVTIVITSGDGDTGREDGNPWTVSRKGQATQDAVNKDQMALFDLQDIPRIAEGSGPQFWVLLIHVDDGAEEIRFELARPAGATLRDHIHDWLERIILPPISLSLPPLLEEELPDDIDINIKPRFGDK